MKNILTLIIVVLSIVLFLLVVVTNIMQRFPVSTPKQSTVMPTAYDQKKPDQNPKNSSQNSQNTALKITPLPIYNEEEISNIEKAREIVVDTPDVDIEYVSVLDKFVINKKTAKADEVLDKWFTDNKLNKNDKKLFVYTNKSISDSKAQIEQEYIEYKQAKNEVRSQNPVQNEDITTQSLTPEPTPDYRQNSINTMIGLFNFILAGPGMMNSSGTDLSPTGGVGILPTGSVLTTPETLISISPTPSKPGELALSVLLNEISQKVGVPYKILEGVLKVEDPRVFNLSPRQVSDYSQPNKVGPNCRPNECSCVTPMGMSTGADASGNTTCPKCCWKGKCFGYCPNAWSLYGGSVNKYGGYIHKSLPCNLRDQLYAGAMKLKTDSKANNASDWTQDQVFRAAKAYYGSCSEDARYPRLGNRTYCEYIWWYYRN